MSIKAFKEVNDRIKKLVSKSGEERKIELERLARIVKLMDPNPELPGYTKDKKLIDNGLNGDEAFQLEREFYTVLTPEDKKFLVEKEILLESTFANSDGKGVEENKGMDSSPQMRTLGSSNTTEQQQEFKEVQANKQHLAREYREYFQKLKEDNSDNIPAEITSAKISPLQTTASPDPASPQSSAAGDQAPKSSSSTNNKDLLSRLRGVLSSQMMRVTRNQDGSFTILDKNDKPAFSIKDGVIAASKDFKMGKTELANSMVKAYTEVHRKADGSYPPMKIEGTDKELCAALKAAAKTLGVPLVSEVEEEGAQISPASSPSPKANPDSAPTAPKSVKEVKPDPEVTVSSGSNSRLSTILEEKAEETTDDAADDAQKEQVDHPSTSFGVGSGV